MDRNYEPWPELPYEKFESTEYLLHRVVQAVGKLKLTTPFEPHWANVALWLTTRGLSTGLISYGKGSIGVNLDFHTHELICSTSWGSRASFKLETMSVSKFIQTFSSTLHKLGVDIQINMMPSEVENPIPFDQDTIQRVYDPALANAWWRILISSYRVLQRYHHHFTGITPPIGLMWGTMDLRDARYVDGKIPDSPYKDFVTRNAYDAPQVEAGWWAGDSTYKHAAYYFLIFPLPKEIGSVKIRPDKARWDNSKQIFIFDYDDARAAKDPDKEIFSFFESAYQASTERAGWDNAHLISAGEPV